MPWSCRGRRRVSRAVCHSPARPRSAATALAAHKKTSSAPPVPPPIAAPAPVPPPAAAKPPARKLDVQLSTRSTALANALDDDESTKGMSAVQRRIKAIEDKMKGKKT